MGLLEVQVLALWQEQVKSQQPQLFSATSHHLHSTGRTQEQPSELLKTNSAALSYVRKLSGLDQLAGKEI